MPLETARKIAYHVKDGATEMYTIDANSAVARCPDEWSFEPWPSDVSAASDKASVDIPDDIGSLSKQQIRALAMKLGAPVSVKYNDAEKMLTDELRRRRAPPQPAIVPVVDAASAPAT